MPGSIAPANYTISLSTTSAAVNGLDTTFANNLGADNAVFFSGVLGGLIGPTNQFTITGTPFNYNPALGNLPLAATSDGDGLQFSVFLDFQSNAPDWDIQSHIKLRFVRRCRHGSNRHRPRTQFTYRAPTSSVPEPGTLWLLATALIGLVLFRRSLS